MAVAILRPRMMAIAAGALVYILAAHYSMSTAGCQNLGTVIALAPLAAAAWSLARQSAHRMTAAAALVAAGAALMLAWPMLTRHYGVIYWIEHAGTELLLCLGFARSLHEDSIPMCTRFARIVHGPHASAMDGYTRQVTKAWVLFFAAMSLASTLLFFSAPLPTWSIFANFFTAPLITSMFIAEYIARRRLHPEIRHAHFFAAIEAFWKSSAQQSN